MNIVGLVACCSQKGSSPCAAKQLYLSSLFRKARAWTEKHCDEWYILSAEHGLLAPNAVIAPYDRTLNRMTASERRAWGERVWQQLAPLNGSRFIVLAGARYCEPLAGLDHERPMQGMGIGYQLAWLSRDV